MVVWSGPAKKDLKQIYDYIARDSKFYARKVAYDVVERVENLDRFPNIGRIVPEVNDPNIKEIFVYSYRVIYAVKPDRVEILTILHGRRDFSNSKQIIP